jgi:ferredoxin
MGMKLSIDYDCCTGHGRCYEVAPDLFTDNDEGYGEVTVESPDESQLDAARLAVNTCPERAVLLDDD